MAKEAGEGLLIGRNPVREALHAGDARIEKVLLQQGGTGRSLHEVRQAAKEQGVPTQFVPLAKLNRLAPGLNHQGIIATFAPIAYWEPDDLLSAIAPTVDEVKAKRPLLLVLDQIEDPYNLGAIIRSAVAAGVAGIFVPKQRMAPLNAAALKTSAGTATRARIARADNLGTLLVQVKERGYWVAGAAGQGRHAHTEMDWKHPFVLVIGGEEKGLRPSIQEACDYLVSIPMFGPVESLNASVATGVLLFAAAADYRQQ